MELPEENAEVEEQLKDSCENVPTEAVNEENVRVWYISVKIKSLHQK